MSTHQHHEKPGKKTPKGTKLMQAMMKEHMGKQKPMMPMKRGM